MQGKLWGTVSPANPHLTYCKRDPCFKACCTHRCLLPCAVILVQMNVPQYHCRILL